MRLSQVIEIAGDVIQWVVVVAMILVLALAFAMAGCGSHPVNDVKPVATVSPSITAGDIKELKQDIKQVQQTITTTNFSLDKERAKIEAKRIRIAQIKSLSTMGVLVGLLIFGMIAPSFISIKYQAIGYIIALAIVVGSIMLPMVWPF